MKRITLAAAVSLTVLAGVPATAGAAELLPYGGRHSNVSERYWNWRERCAWAGYYCLYAWHGYVFHYAWDDHGYATRYPRRYRRRY